METERSHTAGGSVSAPTPASGVATKHKQLLRGDEVPDSRVDANGTAGPGLWKSPLIADLLTPVSMVYGTVAYARMQAYAAGLLKRRTAKVPVVSVGNITVGGTGKTPVTVSLATKFIQQGKRVGILSRGYKRQSRDPFTVVSDGRQVLSGVAAAGDEPYMMAKAVPSAVIVVGKDRVSTAEIAVSEFGCDLILLDDGFQHVRLERDFDVVLLDFNDNMLQERLLPAGRLREPLSALSRATHVIVTKVPESCSRVDSKLESIAQLVRRYAPASSLSMCHFQPTLSGMSSLSLPDTTRGARVVAVCGIARPEQFARTLKSLDLEVLAMHEYSDHHEYGTRDAENLKVSLEKSGADFILTTEKDYHKLAEFETLKDSLGAVVLQASWIGEPPAFKL